MTQKVIQKRNRQKANHVTKSRYLVTKFESERIIRINHGFWVLTVRVSTYMYTLLLVKYYHGIYLLNA